MDHLHHAFRSPETQGFQALDNAVRAATCRSGALALKSGYECRNASDREAISVEVGHAPV